MKVKLLKKACAVSLSALMLTGAGLAEAVPVISTGLSVYAASATPADSFEYEVDGTVTITGFVGNETNVVIPSRIENREVTAIGYNAFRDCTEITSVEIPKSVIEIGDSAFQGCTSLESVKIPNSVIEIQNEAFFKCKSLKQINIPESVTSIGETAFGDCESLESITVPDSVKVLNQWVFSGCTGLKSVTLSKKLTTFGFESFKDCTSLTTISIPDSVTTVENGAFKYCTSLKSISFSDTVEEFGSNMFVGCTSLKSVKLPGKIKSIPLYTFDGCKLLKSIKIPNTVTEIGINAFKDCISLKSVSIPEKVTCIEYGAFVGCKGLTTVYIPDSVDTIREDMFYGETFESGYNLTIYGYKNTRAETYANEKNIPFKVMPVKNVSTVSAKNVTVGDKVKINLKAKGGDTPYKYSVLYKKSTGTKWLTLAANTTKKSVEFTPSAATAYDIKVIAKDGAGNSSSKTLTVKASKPLTNVSKLGAAAKVGDKVKVRCYAQGGAGEYQYAVYYKKASGKTWYKLRGYKSTNLVLFTPKTAAKYDIKVLAKDSSGIVAAKTLTLKVTK